MAAGACLRRRYKIYYSSIVYFDFDFSPEAIQIKLLILTPKCLQLKIQEISIKKLKIKNKKSKK